MNHKVKFQWQHSTASRVSWGPTHSWGFRQGTRKLDCLRCLVVRLLSLLYWSDSGLDCRTMVWFCPNLLTSFGSLWCLWLICKVLKWWLRGSFQKRAAHSNTEERHVAQFEPMTSSYICLPRFYSRTLSNKCCVTPVPLYLSRVYRRVKNTLPTA